MTNYHVWGFEPGRISCYAGFRTFGDAMQFATALQNANDVSYIELESKTENEKRGWKLTIDGWKFQSIEKIED